MVAVAYTVAGLRPGVLGPVPVDLLPFVLLLALLFGSWSLLPQTRHALLSVPLPALVAVHAGRVGGLFFLILYFDGRLSAPFAPAAGICDMVPRAAVLLLPATIACWVSVSSLRL